MMWLNTDLSWKITKLRTTPVIVSYPKQVYHPLNGCLVFFCVLSGNNWIHVGCQTRSTLRASWGLQNTIRWTIEWTATRQCLKQREPWHTCLRWQTFPLVRLGKKVFQNDEILNGKAVSISYRRWFQSQKLMCKYDINPCRIGPPVTTPLIADLLNRLFHISITLHQTR